jgi:hypothetical protein
MSELGKEARALLDAARGADGPTSADRARVRRAVTASVLAGAGSVLSTAKASAAAAQGVTVTWLGLKKVLIALVLVGIAGAGARLVAGRGGEEAAGDPGVDVDGLSASGKGRATSGPETTAFEWVFPAVEPAPAPPPPAATASGDDETVPSKRTVAPRAPPRKVLLPPPELARELLLLHEARAALGRGDSAAALQQVRAHRREFPAGILAAEADATEVLALCDAGRVDAATDAAAQFRSEHRGSPLRGRVEASCAGRGNVGEEKLSPDSDSVMESDRATTKE